MASPCSAVGTGFQVLTEPTGEEDTVIGEGSQLKALLWGSPSPRASLYRRTEV